MDPLETLRQIIAGKTLELSLLSNWEPAQLRESANDVALVVTPRAVMRVLSAFVESRASARDAQAWASFVRWGYPMQKPWDGKPLDIEYAPYAEDVIAHAVSRMDELGDAVDSVIDDDELAELIESFAAFSNGSE